MRVRAYTSNLTSVEFVVFNFFKQPLPYHSNRDVMRTTHIKSITLTLSILLSAASALAQTIIPPGIGALSSSQLIRGKAVLTGVLNSTGGQNPTVKIRWGDEDRGTAVTPAYAWDNEVTVSTSQAAGTFSTTIDIPNLDKIYYFRAVANNAG